MTEKTAQEFGRPGTPAETEQGTAFTPRFDAAGLIGAIVSDALSGEVLMFAYMNADALAATIDTRVAHFWSRSRARIWRKGEESGHFQHVKEMRADCDGDVVLLSVEQEGGIACHTGRESCFFYRREGDRWIPADPVLKDPKEIYAK